jgi:hypothetical protein
MGRTSAKYEERHTNCSRDTLAPRQTRAAERTTNRRRHSPPNVAPTPAKSASSTQPPAKYPTANGQHAQPKAAVSISQAHLRRSAARGQNPLRQEMPTVIQTNSRAIFEGRSCWSKVEIALIADHIRDRMFARRISACPILASCRVSCNRSSVEALWKLRERSDWSNSDYLRLSRRVTTSGSAFGTPLLPPPDSAVYCNCRSHCGA